MRAWEKVIFEYRKKENIKFNYYWTDKNTGLIWEKEHEDITYKWDDINQASDKLNEENFGGFNDWRVPTINELKTILLKDKEKGKYIKNGLKDSTRDGYYWSATTHANNIENAWYVYFDKGYGNGNNKANSYYVRCVRGEIIF